MHNVRVRIVPPATAFIFCLGCGLLEDPEEGNQPPINESANDSPGGGFLPGDTDTDTDTATGGSDSGTTAGSTSGADSTGTGLDLGMGVLFVGTITDGGGAWTPPFDCQVRLYSEDQLDPTTGAADDSVEQYPIELVGFPHELIVTRNDVPAVDFGWEGYIGVRCDTFGDGSYTVGAFHPSLPAQLVTLPVDMVTLDLQFL